jgi:hypothetical protein
VTVKLTRRERHFLSLHYPDGTVSKGTSVGASLYRKGLVYIAKYGRYGITPAGIEALKGDQSQPRLL